MYRVARPPRSAKLCELSTKQRADHSFHGQSSNESRRRERSDLSLREGFLSSLPSNPFAIDRDRFGAPHVKADNHGSTGALHASVTSDRRTHSSSHEPLVSGSSGLRRRGGPPCVRPVLLLAHEHSGGAGPPPAGGCGVQTISASVGEGILRGRVPASPSSRPRCPSAAYGFKIAQGTADDIHAASYISLFV